MLMISRNQKGIGMVEVLVSLVLLAIGVLGYTALQLRAIEAGDEALVKSQATMLLRGLTESIRANPQGQSSYPAAVRTYTSQNAPSAPKSCLNTTCKPAQMATYEAYLVARAANQIGVMITMNECPGVNSIKRQCIFAAWENTLISSNNYSACMSSGGVYVANARCVMMEAY
ncbi:MULTISPECIES: type IV pilus modification protein PilV [unclassified Acinetobacter]|uniref:type IV pilus modification protein PilV n=1 Tax=unclassified Acinetobacter TaxID=196816 RepID=UPI0028822E41|nr:MULTISPECIES: type IV pilus modification protein PilV [unclassified Acinetobacter]MDT0198386.1 type IV pilus modification protein PilV [Acinetobacter sp. RG5]MDT0229838.1 type IV pilus modification protein PilV [Acinetobacter sp. RRD8]